MELALYTSNRLKVYLDFHAQLLPSIASENFRKALVNLFAHVLRFLAHAIQVYQKSSVSRLTQALWDPDAIVQFEEQSDKLCARAAEEASNCDRQIARQWKEELSTRLQSLNGIHIIGDTLTKIQDKADLARLEIAREATYNSFAEGDLARCLSGTRTEVLAHIADWSSERNGKRIFWLCGKAGTGKSTISRTVAQAFDEAGLLGASFFFKRGRADRSYARLLFPTIARQLADSLPAIGHAIAAALDNDSLLCEKHLRIQFDKLLLQPLQSAPQASTLSTGVILVIDALDECDNGENIKMILLLLSRIEAVTSIRLRIFVTSRPELPVELGFKDMSGDLHLDVRLEEAQVMSIGHDIRLFYEHEFAKIRENSWLQFDAFPADWPGEDSVKLLVDLAVPLFIFAFTVARYLSEDDTRGRLDLMLRQSRDRSLTGLKGTYLPILNQLLAPDDEQQSKSRIAAFRAVVGPIVLLSNPLSASSLSILLAIPMKKVERVLQPLHSVLNIPRTVDGGPDPVVTLFHISFRDFLVDTELKNENRFWIDEVQTHSKLATQCIRLLSSGVLKENTFDDHAPGTRRAEIPKLRIQECLPDAVAYACCYWIQHIVRSGGNGTSDDGLVFEFLQKHFLHWMEAMSWLGKTAEVIHNLEALQSIVDVNYISPRACIILILTLSVQVDRGARLIRFLSDASRFAFRNQAIIDQAPLQTYLSALLFAPSQSIIRRSFGNKLGRYLDIFPKVPEQWSAERVKLEGHEGEVSAVAISADGKTVASGSHDETVRVWSTATGEQTLKLDRHEGGVSAVAISADGKTVASGSCDRTVRVWSTATGEQTLRLDGHEDWVSAVAISADGKTVASGSYDETVRVWSTATGEQTLKLDGHEGEVSAVAISADGKMVASGSHDETVRVWSTATGEQTLKLEGHEGEVSAVAISADGKMVASGSHDGTVRVWSTATGEQTLKLDGHEGRVSAVAISADGKTVASGTYDETVRVWSTATGEQTLKLDGHEGRVSAVAISADGKTVASGSGDETVRVWSTAMGEQTLKLDGHEVWVSAVAISADGKTVASGSGDRTVRVWSTAMGEQTLKFDGHENWVSAVAIWADGKTVASGSYDGTVRVWSTAMGEQTLKFDGHENWVSAVAIWADGKTVASGSYDGTVRVWSTATGEQTLKLDGHEGGVSAVAISADGKTVESGSYDGTVRVWSTATGE